AVLLEQPDLARFEAARDDYADVGEAGPVESRPEPTHEDRVDTAPSLAGEKLSVGDVGHGAILQRLAGVHPHRGQHAVTEAVAHRAGDGQGVADDVVAVVHQARYGHARLVRPHVPRERQRRLDDVTVEGG